MQSEEIVSLGTVIDMPFADFKKYALTLNIGVVSTLILSLEAAYNQLRLCKDGCVELALTNSTDEVKQAINSLYAEMIKTEEKITFLKELKESLINLEN